MNLLHKHGLQIISVGSAVPDMNISNKQLSQLVDTSDEWITARTGIKNRRILSPTESLADLAVKAAKNALSKSTMKPEEIDLIILATSSADDLFGSAGEIQKRIGASNAIAFDITAACSGFIVSLIIAHQFIATRTYNNILIIGADVLSRWVNWLDRNTCILFGDAAGAMLIKSSNDDRLLGFQLKTNGRNNEDLVLPHISKYKKLTSDITINQGSYNYISMNGREVYKFATSEVPKIIKNTLESINMDIAEVDWLVLHQANKRILKTIADKLGLPSQKVLSNLELYGNTSAASLPLVLDEAIEQNRIKTNDIVVLAGFGAGLTWGAIVIKWS